MRLRWLEKLIIGSAKLQNVLRGRYAQFDPLNRALLGLSLGLIVINLFLQTILLRFAVLIVLVLVYYRFFSKRIYVRINENTKYLTYQNLIRNKLNGFHQRLQHRKDYRYFTCPACQQKLRAPRGRGKIKVTCSNCQEQFIKKV